MTLSEFSVRRPVFAWMLMIGLIVFGAISFTKMGISQLPDVDFPVVSVSLTYEGAAPEVMETDVVDIVEDAVMSVQGIRSVASYSRYGTASIAIEFDLDRNIDAALQEVQTKVAQAQKQLPKEMDTPVITKTNPEDNPIMWLTIASETVPRVELMRYVRDQLKDKFTTVAGVGDVMLGGYVEPNLRIWASNEKLNQYELTVGDILDTVQNEHSELPAGQIETERREYDVRTMGEARGIDEFGDIVISARGGRPNYNPIVLKKVAKIEEGLAEVRRISRFNGKPAIGLGIKKQRGVNAVEVAHNVKARMEQVRSNLPKGMELNVNFDTTKFIEETVHELNFTLILSAILTALVCWLFLGSLSSTINILFAIPTSIIGAFTILYFFGFTLNTFTLLGLSLAVGIVVDDAIMVLENIVRHQEMGKTKFQAAIDGANEITFAAIAATIAIVAIFLPVAFMRGVIGKFFLQFGVTMTVTVLLSLLEALTLTPMRCAQFVSGAKNSKAARKMDALFEKISRFYEECLGWALAHRGKVVLGSLLIFAVSLLSLTKINKEFVPSQDQSIFLIRLQTPVDSSMAYTDSKFKIAEEVMMKQSEVERIYAAVGGFGGGEVNSGNIFVTMKDKGKRGIRDGEKREMTQQDFMAFTRKELSKIPEMKVFIQDLSMRGFTASRGYPVEFSVRGPDWDKLSEYSRQIMDALQKTGLVTDLDTDYKLGKPEVRIIPDREKAARYGVSIRTISEAIRALIGGEVSGKYAMNGHRYDIRVRLQAEDRSHAEQIKNIYVRNNRGEIVRLSNVVRIEERASLQQIARYDRERAVTVYSNIKQGQSQQKVLAEVQALAAQILPNDYRLVLSGSAQTFKESFQDLIFALILGVFVAYMVLGAQFNSFIHPITVLIALPFSLSGAFLALMLMNLSLNIYSFIGLILLMGIVKKNSILLVEFTNQVREKGEKDIRKALLYACPIRLRPILMTSIATVAGAIPPALAIGPGAETRIPMAVCVIGGVLVSTFLTLFVVPCVYSLFSRFDSNENHGGENEIPAQTSTAAH
ncbi:MAG: efflux RND transporter permease subunit [Deltaproteobacteria bacterium]|nr:efflux RND transporter permease subunit [Deltaproteobacteria bacterium]